MTPQPGKTRIRRRGALLLILAGLAAVAPLAGREAMQARADDGGSDGGSGGSGSGSSGSGSDGGSDSSDGGSDDGGDDGGDDHGGGSSGSGGRGGGTSQGSSSAGGNQKQGQGPSQRDGDLAARLKGRIAPLSEVESLAGRTVPGEIIDVKLYRQRDTYVYKVKIIQQTGSIYDVRIDAVTRKVLSARER